MAPSNKSVFIPTINVCGNEVPLPAYWKIIELYDLGYSTESIASEVLHYAGSSEAGRIEEIVFHVIDNQVRIRDAPADVKRWSVMPKRRPDMPGKHKKTASKLTTEPGATGSERTQQEEQKQIADAFVLLRNDDTLHASAYLITGEFESKMVKEDDVQEVLQKRGLVKEEFRQARSILLQHHKSAFIR